MFYFSLAFSAIIFFIGVIIIIISLPKIRRIRKYNREVDKTILFQVNSEFYRKYPQESKVMNTKYRLFSMSFLLFWTSLSGVLFSMYTVSAYRDFLPMKITCAIMITFSIISFLTFKQYHVARMVLYNNNQSDSEENSEFLKKRKTVVQESIDAYKYYFCGATLMAAGLLISTLYF